MKNEIEMVNMAGVYNTIAERWFKDHRNSSWVHALVDQFTAFLPKNAKILDAGCGPGIKSYYMRYLGCSVTGIDYSENMIAIAKKYFPGIDFSIRDILEPINLGKFDGVFAHAVLLHIPKAEIVRALANLKNSLTKEGFLYLGVKEMKPGMPGEQNIIDEKVNFGYKSFYSFFTFKEISDYLDKVGMEVAKETTVIKDGVSWLAVIAKNKIKEKI